MDNENKITRKNRVDEASAELIENSKAEFLPKEFQDPEARMDVYSLEEEYAKSRRNKSTIVYTIVAGFLGAVIAGSIAYTIYIQNIGKNITIDISDFEDVKLLELITQTRQGEAKIADMRQELFELKTSLEDEIDRIRQEFSGLKDAVLAKEISEEERRTQLRDINARQSERINAVQRRYEARIGEKEKTIASLEDEVAETKRKLGPQGQLTQSVLGSNDELYNLQNDKIRDYYTKRIDTINTRHQQEIDHLIELYNPKFTESQLNQIIARSVRDYRMPSRMLDGVDNDLKRENAASDQEISLIRKNISEQQLLLNRLQRIPYKNSIPRSILHIESLSKSSALTYDEIVRDLVREIRKKNETIASYTYALDNYIRNESESGFVLDARNPSRIALYVNRNYPVKDGDIAYVFRSDDEMIGSIRVQILERRYYGVPVQINAGKSIMPFDKIMLQVVRER